MTRLRFRRFAGIVAVALAVVACSCSKGEDGLARTSPSTSPPGSPTNAVTASPRAVPDKAPKGWKTYSHQSIAFSYPPLLGRVRAVSNGDGGPRRAWTIERSDLCDPRGTCRSYEFAALNDACPGSQPWPTFAHRWVERSGAHSLSTCAGAHSIEIRPLRVVVRPDGLRGVIYDANEWFSSEQRIDGALAAVLNFPAGFHEHYEAIAFYFEDRTPLATVETVLRVVALNR